MGWVWVLAVALVLPVGAFGWSWFRPVTLDFGQHGAVFGYGWPAVKAFSAVYNRYIVSRPEVVFREFPVTRFLGGGSYFVWWY